MKATKSSRKNGKADARHLIVRAIKAEKNAKAARKQARLAKMKYREARKAFKQARRAAKQARREAKLAVKTVPAKTEKARKPQKRKASDGESSVVKDR
ncbi:MAG TPA: hypothetical protein VN578_24120 [Candidatus Binatia bacterium]|jgi:hypothetical protein|nr:hypothetical protein [Candidatus Binatia bacterium]